MLPRLRFAFTSLRLLPGKGGKRSAVCTGHLAGVMAAADAAGAFGNNGGGNAAMQLQGGETSAWGNAGGGDAAGRSSSSSRSGGGRARSIRGFVRALSSANRANHGTPPASPFAAVSAAAAAADDGGEAGGGAIPHQRQRRCTTHSARLAPPAGFAG